jgi:hypothetical protein
MGEVTRVNAVQQSKNGVQQSSKRIPSPISYVEEHIVGKNGV